MTPWAPLSTLSARWSCRTVHERVRGDVCLPNEGRSESRLAARCSSALAAATAAWLDAAAAPSARADAQDAGRLEEWCRHDLHRRLGGALAPVGAEARLGADLAPVAPSRPDARFDSEWGAVHRARRASPSALRRRDNLSRQHLEEGPASGAEESHQALADVLAGARARGRLPATARGERHDAVALRSCQP